MSNEEELRQKAKETAEAKLGFYIHFTVYVCVNVLLFFIWFFTRNLDPFPWFIFPLVGWGIGVLAHYLNVFHHTNITDRMAEKEYQKLKKQQ